MKTHGQSHDETGGGIEKAQADDVVLDKFCQRKENDLENIGGDVLSVEFLNPDVSVEIYFF